jgi:hypothetical protein
MRLTIWNRHWRCSEPLCAASRELRTRGAAQGRVVAGLALRETPPIGFENRRIRDTLPVCGPRVDLWFPAVSQRDTLAITADRRGSPGREVPGQYIVIRTWAVRVDSAAKTLVGISAPVQFSGFSPVSPVCEYRDTSNTNPPHFQHQPSPRTKGPRP